ncbi:putative C-mannosyltransferase DPY19L3 isoform X1 [Labeo rohita]|uniref:Putative C-mannosyltransferase DPY19L3 isoform X1 n=1 Tax=Labeo rohita TaxID=84645 RepID=A0A498L6I1_LABRO|nr:putative C-mannosyltransferase DPY19L3 isoform X1 [Labeo rohita]
MTRVRDGEVPIRDLSLRCGQVAVEVSLWRDEALVELSLGDHIEISCLRASLKPSPKLNSSSYSAVEKTVAEPVEVELTFIGVLEGDGGATVLLSDAYEEYTVLAAPALDIAADDLPIKLTLTHRNKTVQSIEPLGEMFEGMFEEV